MIHHPRIAIAMMVAGLLAQADVQRVDGREINAQNEEEQYGSEAVCHSSVKLEYEGRECEVECQKM
jgi:hypothetical protein